jgi:NADH:ubiquinone oxidoreductase subunit 5 (subunit L)/multisubunit Na+/H+ antiporter MnhA subunit
MRRERVLKIVLVLVGLLFVAGVVPLAMFFSREPAVPMIMSIYVTLGFSCCWRCATQRRAAA